jgi:hypothetical protein
VSHLAAPFSRTFRPKSLACHRLRSAARRFKNDVFLGARLPSGRGERLGAGADSSALRFEGCWPARYESGSVRRGPFG